MEKIPLAITDFCPQIHGYFRRPQTPPNDTQEVYTDPGSLEHKGEAGAGLTEKQEQPANRNFFGAPKDTATTGARFCVCRISGFGFDAFVVSQS